jgi:hypothetical protein
MMENAPAWNQLLTAATVFGGGMLFSSAYRRYQAGVSPVITAADMIESSLMGLCFAMILVFRWHAFSYPLGLITVPALGIVFLKGPYGLELLRRIRASRRVARR